MLFSHRHHYPPKELPGPGVGIELQTGGVPFTARTVYMDEFFSKPRASRPVEPLTYSASPMPWLTVRGPHGLGMLVNDQDLAEQHGYQLLDTLYLPIITIDSPALTR